MLQQRYLCLWFQHVCTDWYIRRNAALQGVPFVLAAPLRGRLVVTDSSAVASRLGIHVGMVVADCRARVPELQVLDALPNKAEQLLAALAEWCLRYTPTVAVHAPDSLLLNTTGCSHLWAGEPAYVKEILDRFHFLGYHVRAALADTIGAAWALAHFGQAPSILASGQQVAGISPLPPAALRLAEETCTRLQQLGFHRIGQLLPISERALLRRFGSQLPMRLGQACGQVPEILPNIEVATPYQERLPCLEPIRLLPGIEIALRQLLEALCSRLHQEAMGLRTALLKAYRIDGAVQQVQIGTHKASRHPEHLFRLFQLKISSFEPALGFELFVLEAPLTEPLTAHQERLWAKEHAAEELLLAQLLDRFSGKLGSNIIHRYLPAEHYWPERSLVEAQSLQQTTAASWLRHRSRPMLLLPQPEAIEVTVALPDYPPLLFRHKGVLHRVLRADGPERIEREWWLGDTGPHRDYYGVEDEEGLRYWIFRSGHYATGTPEWFLHGFFS
ncbi:MAG: DNA polymerase Y family protein [Bacteroidetes bacterium]|nr:DNA polymerase Y family protein [Bacteroidota bacterium]